jgi:hypothetical protein
MMRSCFSFMFIKMKYVLDVNDAKVRQVMEELGVEPQQLLVR